MVQTVDKGTQLSKNSLAGKFPTPGMTQISHEMYSGPLPHADMIAKYENVLPGSADRIIKMAEKQEDHRHRLESTVVASNILNERIGMSLAFILSFVAILGGIFLIYFGKDLQGLLTVGAPLGLQLYNYMSKQKREDAVESRNRNGNAKKNMKKVKHI